MPKETAKDLLLEIGVEELPARFIPPALEALKSLGEAAFKDAGLKFKSTRSLGTPRRLALLVEGLALKAEDRVQENLGPGMAQAKDAQGNWTPAAQGFARAQGTTPDTLEVRETERGPRLCAVRRETGLPAEKVLPSLLPELIKKIPFPKNMVWEESRFSFARPIRWIAALYGARVIKFSLAGVRSGNKTFGLRIHGKKAVVLPSPAKYEHLLKDRLVVVDPSERRGLVEKQIHQAIKSVKGCVPLEDHAALLEEVTNLVEHPVGILGSFDPKRLELPPEVLVTSMKKHQKYFPVFDEGGKLLAHFVGIRNGMSENQVVVREGYERVLAARLSDAEFFYREDLKTTLEAKAPLLKGVLFQKELGSVWDKIERVAGLAAHLGETLRLSDEEKSVADGVARLGKADLVSAMVGEFPELQGVMGRIYARVEGLPPRVAEGIELHYWPLTADGALPEDAPAAVVSLADKLDTLAGDFLVGLIPTGSQDPYGLRRAAVGVLRILEAKGWRFSLKAVLERALAGFPSTVQGDRAKALQSLLGFLRQRWSALLEAERFRPDEILAVSAAGFDDPVDARRRLNALHDIRRHQDFEPLSIAFKRVIKIVKQAAEKKEFSIPVDGEALPIRRELLVEEAEQILSNDYLNLRGLSEPMMQAGNYDLALANLVRFREPVDHFFEKVMVMAPEMDRRQNRLALLFNIVLLFRGVADLSQLQDTPIAGK